MTICGIQGLLFVRIAFCLMHFILTGKERYSGTTATVCLLIDNIHLHTASVGDSRALLCHKVRPYMYVFIPCG